LTASRIGGNLVTGGAGFVWFALAEHLLGEGEETVVFDMRPPPAFLLKVAGDLPPRLHAVQGEVRNPAALGAAFAAARVAQVFYVRLLGFLHGDEIGVGKAAIAGALRFALILSVRHSLE
jgi:nucleoside-diphosphate-sugar epimerase